MGCIRCDTEYKPENVSLRIDPVKRGYLELEPGIRVERAQGVIYLINKSQQENQEKPEKPKGFWGKIFSKYFSKGHKLPKFKPRYIRDLEREEEQKGNKHLIF